jgi:hypothetical protein
MGLNFWWVRNDGIGGHVWLSPGDVLALTEEMLAQGMAWQREGEPERASSPTPPRPGIPVHKLVAGEGEIVTPVEIVQALEAASAEPKTFSDRRLWQDWLMFLDGAAKRGGILTR